MTKREFEIKNPTGLHARPAARFVALCKSSKCKMTIECDDKKADAKSIFSVLGIGASMGKTVTVSADGDGEEEILEKVAAFLSELEE